MEFFEVLNNLSYDKKQVSEEKNFEKFFMPFKVNKYFSFFSDTIFHANEINCLWQLDKKMQHDFYLFSVRKKKRYTTWLKKLAENDIELVKEVYGYNDAKASEVINIIGKTGLDKLKLYVQKGGIDNKE